MIGMQIPVLLVASFVLISSRTTLQSEITYGSSLIGVEECGNGPSYWCQTFKTAKTCNAMKHCIQTVWEHQVLPVDDSNICKVCKDMVQQARDQLQSNETQEELKEVFEGSCNLIPIKTVAKECCQVADDFIPELIEALSSQMNPQVVCSVAGLCNSARIAQLLGTTTTQVPPTSAMQRRENELDCAGCRYVSAMIEGRFQKAHKDDVLNMFIEMCGKMGSFSDGCAATVITYFQEIYSSLVDRLRPNETCHLAGVCSPKYHIHADKLDSFSKAVKDDDLPCELCEQLVQHLADIMVTNTTEQEFEQVLLGICSQTKSFKDECVNIVREYYPAIYELLTKELDGKVICTQIGICKKNGFLEGKFDAPLYPLLPVDMIEELKSRNRESTTEKPNLHVVSLERDELSVQSGSPALQVEMLQLPVDRLIPQAMLPRNKETCEMCEYFLHYLQVEITDPTTEQQLKHLVQKVCDKLPQSVAPQCRDFVDIYGDAFVAILAQKIDPSQVCPSIGVCPGLSENSQVLIEVNDKPTCPLCLMTMETLVKELKDNKTEAQIKKMLDNVCYTMPKTVTQDCLKFVDKYMEELIDMIIADFTPQEICVYAKLCDAPKSLVGGDISTNEIPETLEDQKKDSNQCVLCEFIMSKLEKELQDKKTEAEIKEAVLHICHVLPGTVKDQCNKFVEEYADLIIEILATSMNPKGVCTVIKLCQPSPIKYIKKSVNKCIICESLMGALLGILEDEDVELSMNRKLELACNNLPTKMKPTCKEIVFQLAPQIENILQSIPAGPLVCRKLLLCNGRPQRVNLLGRERCTWGPGYWCQTTTTAAECNAIDHCQTKVWMANKPKLFY